MADGIQAIEVPIGGYSESRDIAEESSGNASDQAQVKVEKRIAEPESNHNNTNDEERTDPNNASSLVVPEHVAAEVNTSLQNLDGDSESHNAPDFSAPEFNTYNEINDESKQYNSRKQKTRCYNCGRRGHEGHLCKRVTSCVICSKRGHLVMNCPNKNSKEDFTSRLCLKCGNTGHDMFTCANAYDPEDLEDIECYICGKVGHLCCVEDSTKGETEEDSCYKCGEWGHFGSECMKVPRSFCYKCKITGHYTKHCPEKDARNFFCHNCKIRGHYTKQCPRKARAALKRSERALRKLINSANQSPPNSGSHRHADQARAALKSSEEALRKLIDSENQSQPNSGSHLHADPDTRDQNICLNAQNKPDVSQILLPLNQEPLTTLPPGSEVRPPPEVQNPAPNVNPHMDSQAPLNDTACLFNI